jgi:hypothetical protein
VVEKRNCVCVVGAGLREKDKERKKERERKNVCAEWLLSMCIESEIFASLV